MLKFMKNTFFLFLFLLTTRLFSQVDYSDSWEDFYSYNNVKDFVKANNIIYALVDNAVFTFDVTTYETKKFSSIQGLSGQTTSAIYYNSTFKRLIIGYENGLIEVIDDDNSITISSDLANFNQSGEKSVNHISEFGNTLYLSTPFAIVEYDIKNLEFGDTFFIGKESSSLRINETTILNSTIYAATEKGIFTANVTNKLLIDFNNWRQEFAGNFSHISNFNNQVFVADNNTLFQLNGTNLIQINDFFEPIVGLKSSSTHLTISLQKSANIFDISLNQISSFGTSTDFDFTLFNAFFEDNSVYLATQEFGILKSTLNQSAMYEEIHPDGPSSNDVFSIDAANNQLWVVYGGYDETYTPIQRRRGFSHFNGGSWINTKFNPNFPVIDLNHISIDPNAENRVFISSFGDTRDINTVSTGGLLVVENDEIKNFYNHKNSTLEDIVPNELARVTVRVSGTAFDSRGNLWVSSINFNQELKKLSTTGTWSSFDLSSLKTIPDALGLSEIAIDRGNNVWMGTRRNGLFVFNENGNRKKILLAIPNQGNLPNNDVFSVAADSNGRIWIGTNNGLVVFRGTSSVFDSTVLNAQPVIIEENNVGERLLGDQKVTSIVVDGADNKWFGTDSGGVLYTNPSGQRTIANFSSKNSPLPSNRILKIRVDNSSGKVFFATDKGIVAYNSKVAPFGEVLAEVYSYPNPALKNHEIVTIAGRKGTNLPRGTNVKILDVAGNLVYETNVVEGQEVQGGKVVWNKKNLAGKQVASGVYIVLLSANDGAQTAVTKIAIVN